MNIFNQTENIYYLMLILLKLRKLSQKNKQINKNDEKKL